MFITGKKSLSTQKKMIQEEFPQAEHLLHLKKDFNSEGNDLFSKNWRGTKSRPLGVNGKTPNALSTEPLVCNYHHVHKHTVVRARKFTIYNPTVIVSER